MARSRPVLVEISVPVPVLPVMARVLVARSRSRSRSRRLTCPPLLVPVARSRSRSRQRRSIHAVWPASMSPPCRSSVGPAPAPAQTFCCLLHVLDKIHKQLYMVCFKGAAKIGPSCRDARQVCGYLWDSGRKDTLFSMSAGSSSRTAPR